MMRRLLAICTAWIVVALPVVAADPALQAAAAFYDNVRQETFPNGLRVVLKPIPGAMTVTTMVVYKVGACDEDLEATGLAHYLEHLMFKGTDKLKPGDIDRMTLRNGGRNNAWTSEDLTSYHFDFAADRWEPVLDIEADRMRNLRIDTAHEFEKEKGAVIAELDGNEDNPFELERKAILPRLFGAEGPYGHPVIGERLHVRRATAEVIKGYYDRWYHPNNAVVCICGGFDPDRAMQLIKEKLGPIPSATLPERKVVSSSARSAPVQHKFTSKFDSPRLVFGYNSVQIGHPDESALTVLATVLTGGKASRLYRTLVEEKQVASGAQASNQAGRYPGWFDIELELLPDQKLPNVENMVLAELEKLATKPIENVELNRIKRQLIAGEVFAKENTHSLCEHLATGVALRGFDELKKSLEKIMAVTSADVRRVAEKYLDPKTRVVVASEPTAGGGAAAPIKGAATLRRQNAPAGGGGYDLTKTQKVTLPNGLTLLLLENHRLPIVVAQAFVRNVRLSEPAESAGVASLMGSLLDEGTTTHTGPEIATLIENVGGDLSMSPAGGTVRVLSGDVNLGLGLLVECLTHPAFPQPALERLKLHAIAALDEAQKRPDLRAELLFQSLIYGPQHPLGRPSLGTKETLTKLTIEDCKRFHARTFVPNRTVLAVVGDFNTAAVRAAIEKLTADWKSGDVAPVALPAPTKPEKFTERIVSLPAAAQLYFHLGHVGIRRNDPDYYALLVMDYVLGTGPGFTDRLSSKVRDREGLAYTVSANITGNAGDEPGTFACFVGTYPDRLLQVKNMVLQEINKLRAEPPSEREVEEVKQYLTGSIPFRVLTSANVAEQLLTIERFGLGLDYLEQFRKRVSAVTPVQVQAMANKHLDPAHFFLVAVGAVDQTGKPLKP